MFCSCIHSFIQQSFTECLLLYQALGGGVKRGRGWGRRGRGAGRGKPTSRNSPGNWVGDENPGSHNVPWWEFGARVYNPAYHVKEELVNEPTEVKEALGNNIAECFPPSISIPIFSLWQRLPYEVYNEYPINASWLPQALSMSCCLNCPSSPAFLVLIFMPLALFSDNNFDLTDKFVWTHTKFIMEDAEDL